MNPHASAIRKGKALLVGPRYAEGTVRYASRMAKASRMVKEAKEGVVAAHFDAFRDSPIYIKTHTSIEKALEFYKKNPHTAAAIYNHEQ